MLHQTQTKNPKHHFGQASHQRVPSTARDALLPEVRLEFPGSMSDVNATEKSKQIRAMAIFVGEDPDVFGNGGTRGSEGQAHEFVLGTNMCSEDFAKKAKNVIYTKNIYRLDMT